MLTGCVLPFVVDHSRSPPTFVQIISDVTPIGCTYTHISDELERIILWSEYR